jgi:hypothetical protein
MQRSAPEAVGDVHPQFGSPDGQMHDLAQRNVAEVVAIKRITGLDQLLGRCPGANPARLSLAAFEGCS